MKRCEFGGWRRWIGKKEYKRIVVLISFNQQYSLVVWVFDWEPMSLGFKTRESKFFFRWVVFLFWAKNLGLAFKKSKLKNKWASIVLHVFLYFIINEINNYYLLYDTILYFNQVDYMFSRIGNIPYFSRLFHCWYTPLDSTQIRLAYILLWFSWLWSLCGPTTWVWCSGECDKICCQQKLFRVKTIPLSLVWEVWFSYCVWYSSFFEGSRGKKIYSLGGLCGLCYDYKRWCPRN